MSAFTLVGDGSVAAEVKALSCVLAIGNFDGVHRGHQAVIAEVAREAKSRKLAAYVLTFDPHPLDVVGKGAPPALTALDRRAELLLRAGADRVFVRTFDASFAAWPPEKFARELVGSTLSAKTVVVGANFRFGAKAAGDLAKLAELGAEVGFTAHAHAMATDEGGAYSSSRARDAIAAGDVAEAERVLGRPHALTGVVVKGDQRGRTIGFPTANLEGIVEASPPNGVYAIVADEIVDGEARALARGVMNLGVRPTIDGSLKKTNEAHFFELSRDLYDARIRVHLVARLRAEKKFGSLGELKEQIAKDAEAAKTLTGVAGDRGRGVRVGHLVVSSRATAREPARPRATGRM